MGWEARIASFFLNALSPVTTQQPGADAHKKAPGGVTAARSFTSGSGDPASRVPRDFSFAGPPGNYLSFSPCCYLTTTRCVSYHTYAPALHLAWLPAGSS